MLLGKSDNVSLTDQRLAACHHVEEDTKLFALGYDAVKILIGKTDLMTVFC